MSEVAYEKIAASSKRAAILSLLGGVTVISSLIYSSYEFSKIKDDVERKRSELTEVEEILTQKTDELASKNAQLDSLNQQISESAQQLDLVRLNVDRLPTSCRVAELQKTLTVLDTRIGSALIDAQSTVSETPHQGSKKPVDILIEGLFASSASERGRSYDELMSNYSASSDLIPNLLDYASKNPSNTNGVYNTLVVLSHLDYSKIKNVDTQAIREFAENVRGKGPKTAQRVDKLLSRLPR